MELYTSSNLGFEQECCGRMVDIRSRSSGNLQGGKGDLGLFSILTFSGQNYQFETLADTSVDAGSKRYRRDDVSTGVSKMGDARSLWPRYGR